MSAQSRLCKKENDTIFGGMETGPERFHLAESKIIALQHHNQKSPLNPRPGDKVSLFVTAPASLAAKALRIAITTDRQKPPEIDQLKLYKTIWSDILWDYVQQWRYELLPQKAGTMLRYQIWAELGGGEGAEKKLLFADNQAHSADSATNFALYYGEDHTPEWSRSATVYQIFVDRFNPGHGRDWVQTSDLRSPMGGTLRGVTEKLDYIKGMGFDCIWLTPVFASPSHHGYDASDYLKIEPRLGAEADLRELLDQAHVRNMRVLLDFVANHSSNLHPEMLKELDQQAAAGSSWFEWKEWPQYHSFFDVPSMPKLDLRLGGPARQHLLEVAQYWLRFGADGFRCDYASGPEADFWVDFRKACRDVRPDCWLFGEVIRPADEQRQFAGGLDGTLDFLLCQKIRQVIAFGNGNEKDIQCLVDNARQFFPNDFSRPAFIDNHDMDRFYFICGEDLEKLKAALKVLYSLRQPIIVYAGTENLMSQHESIHAPGSIGMDASRLPMDWSRPAVLAAFLKELTEKRTELLSQAL